VQKKKLNSELKYTNDLEGELMANRSLQVTSSGIVSTA